MKVFLVLLLGALFVAALAKDELEPLNCPDGEIETECYAHCQGTCEKPYVACLPICTRGCICSEGQLRNGDGGPCIPASEC